MKCSKIFKNNRYFMVKSFTRICFIVSSVVHIGNLGKRAVPFATISVFRAGVYIKMYRTQLNFFVACSELM